MSGRHQIIAEKQSRCRIYHCIPATLVQRAWVIRSILTLLIVAGLISCSSKDPNDPNFVVANVNGTKILRAELDESVDLFLKSQGGSREQVPAQMLPQLEYQMLNQIIDGMLVVNALNAENSAKLAEEVEKEYAAFKERFEDDASYQDMLSKLGMTEEMLKKQIREGVAQRMMIEEARENAPQVSDEQAKAFYEGNPQYWERPEMVMARHILIKADKSASAEDQAAAKKSAEAARKRVTDGEDFAAVASEVSEDPGSKARGGMLPPFGQGQMVPEFEKMAFTSKQGVVSPVFQSDFGYHFLEVINKQPAGTASFEEVVAQIKENLQSSDVRKVLEAKLQKLRLEADVEVMIPEPTANMDSAMPPGSPSAPTQ